MRSKVSPVQLLPAAGDLRDENSNISCYKQQRAGELLQRGRVAKHLCEGDFLVCFYMWARDASASASVFSGKSGGFQVDCVKGAKADIEGA